MENEKLLKLISAIELAKHDLKRLLTEKWQLIGLDRDDEIIRFILDSREENEIED